MAEEPKYVGWKWTFIDRICMLHQTTFTEFYYVRFSFSSCTALVEDLLPSDPSQCKVIAFVWSGFWNPFATEGQKIQIDFYPKKKDENNHL
jgi:hypothetical protein